MSVYPYTGMHVCIVCTAEIGGLTAGSGPWYNGSVSSMAEALNDIGKQEREERAYKNHNLLFTPPRFSEAEQSEIAKRFLFSLVCGGCYITDENHVHTADCYSVDAKERLQAARLLLDRIDGSNDGADPEFIKAIEGIKDELARKTEESN